MAVLGGCAAAQNGQPTPMNQALDRSDAHLVLLWAAADSGHREAAYELCQYYGFVVFDEKKGTLLAGASGQARLRACDSSLGNLLVESSSPVERRRGRILSNEQARTDTLKHSDYLRAERIYGLSCARSLPRAIKIDQATRRAQPLLI
jgi:hypothetical protein